MYGDAIIRFTYFDYFHLTRGREKYGMKNGLSYVTSQYLDSETKISTVLNSVLTHGKFILLELVLIRK